MRKKQNLTPVPMHTYFYLFAPVIALFCPLHADSAQEGNPKEISISNYKSEKTTTNDFVYGEILRKKWNITSTGSLTDTYNHAKANYNVKDTNMKKIYLGLSVYDVGIDLMSSASSECWFQIYPAKKCKSNNQFLSLSVSVTDLLSAVKAVSVDNYDVRFSFEKSKTKGVAKIKKTSSDGFVEYLSYSDDIDKIKEKFSLNYKKTGIHFFPEDKSVPGNGRLYFGFEYTEYELPTAITFTEDLNETAYIGYDPKLNTKIWSYVFGTNFKNALGNKKTNYSKFFFDGKLGAGIGKASLSKDFSQKVVAKTGKGKIVNTNIASLEAEIDMGWGKNIVTSEFFFKKWQFFMGIRANYRNIIPAGESYPSEDELQLNFERNDIYYGPYAAISGNF